MVEAYCVKCKREVPIEGGQLVTPVRGYPRINGKCGRCGSNVADLSVNTYPGEGNHRVIRLDERVSNSTSSPIS